MNKKNFFTEKSLENKRGRKKVNKNTNNFEHEEKLHFTTQLKRKTGIIEWVNVNNFISFIDLG